MYPETVKQAEQWFDSSGGRNSILAAVLRQADGSGLARGSTWCPGLSTPEEKPEPAIPFIDRDGGAHASTSDAGVCQSMGLVAVHLPKVCCCCARLVSHTMKNKAKSERSSGVSCPRGFAEQHSSA